MATAKAEKAKEYRTLTQLMEQPAGECLDAIARVAPAIERVLDKSGLLDMLIEKQGTADSEDDAGEIVKEFMRALLRYGMGECQGDMVEIIAAINGTTPEQLRKECTGWELVKMIKTILTDRDFFTSVRALLQ